MDICKQKLIGKGDFLYNEDFRKKVIHYVHYNFSFQKLIAKTKFNERYLSVDNKSELIYED